MKKMNQMGADASHSSTTKVKIMAAYPTDFNSNEPNQLEMVKPEKKKGRKKKKANDLESVNGLPQQSSIDGDSLDYQHNMQTTNSMAAGGYDSRSALNQTPQGALDVDMAEENRNDSPFPPVKGNNSKP